MRITASHYYYFGSVSASVGASLVSPAGWEALRLSNADDNPFTLPADRRQWEKDCQTRIDLRQRAASILRLVQDHNLNAVFSAGVGCAQLEFHLKQLAPSLYLTCTDYTPGVVERLRTIFPECDRVECFDMLASPWPTLMSALYLLNRVDTEFSDTQFESVFARMAEAGADHVLVIPTSLLSAMGLCKEWLNRVAHTLARHPLTFAGYHRNRGSFEAAWSRHYVVASEVHLGDGRGFYLHRRDMRDQAA
jgi:hypothetical protein